MFADCGHRVMLMSANVGSMITPADTAIEKLYEDAAGYIPGDAASDDGSDETELTNWLMAHTFDNQQMMAHAPVRIRYTDHIKWTIQKYGGIRFCIQLPQSAEDQFDRGLPWDVVPNDGGILGGHDILGTHYIGDQFFAVTWGKLIPVTLAFLRRYLFEAHAEVWSTWLTASHRTLLGDDLTALMNDLVHIQR